MLPLALIAMTTLVTVRENTLYVGTYTDPNGSKGIYRVRLNQETGALSQSELVGEATAPSYLCVRPEGKFLYAVNEYSKGEVTAFAIGKEGLRKLNTITFDGNGPCHISVDPSGKCLFVSAYGGGTLTVLPIKADGSVGAVTDRFKNSGSGPNKGRQEGPHLHFADLVGKHLYGCDLGTDELLRFDFDVRSGDLKRALPSARTEPGAGPRHFVGSRDGKWLYTTNEMTMAVAAFKRDTKDGSLKLFQTLSTIGERKQAEGWSTAAIKLHPKLPILYVSNRGSNSISVFEVTLGGTLRLLSVFGVDVSEPRDFSVDPSGRWMVVAGQRSGGIQTLGIDPTSGLLVKTPYKSQISKPVCVVFAP